MSIKYSRREALALGIGSLAGLVVPGLAGCNAPTATPSTTQNPINLKMFFWGSATRDKFTKQAMDLFHRSYPNISITSQVSDNNTYWNKLDAQIASGNLFDLIQMDMRYIAKYVRKRVLLDLSQLIYNQTIDLSDFDPEVLASSKVNNTIYGIPLGNNYQGIYYDTTLLEQVGFSPLPENMRWETFADYSIELTKALGNGIYGTADLSGSIASFEVWIRQRGKELYNHDGYLNFELKDAVDWFSYWSHLRSAKGCPPADVQAKLDLSGTPNDSSVIKGKTVFAYLWSNQYEAYQKASQRPLAITMMPTGSTPGMYLKSSMLLSISAETKYPIPAADFISFIINDANAIKALGIERGIPGSAKARSVLSAAFTPTQLAVMTYLDRVKTSGKVRIKEVLDSPGASGVQTALLSVSQKVGLGKTSVADGASEFFTLSQKAVGQPNTAS